MRILELGLREDCGSCMRWGDGQNTTGEVGRLNGLIADKNTVILADQYGCKVFKSVELT